MEQVDVDLRNATYGRFVELGRAPTVGEMAEAMGLSLEEARAGWHRLHAAHAIVLDLENDELIMANPFSARPTAFRVQADGRSWFANCAWDAFGVGAALGVDSVIETNCPDCTGPIRMTVTNGDPKEADLVFHVLVPAAQWWDDIQFT